MLNSVIATCLSYITFVDHDKIHYSVIQIVLFQLWSDIFYFLCLISSVSFQSLYSFFLYHPNFQF